MIQKDEYRRHLPHIVPFYGCFHVTFRIKGSLSNHIAALFAKNFIEQKTNFQFNSFDTMDRLSKIRDLYKNYYEQFELEIHKNREDRLSNPANASLVKGVLHHFDHQHYQLVCYSIMSNYVHVIFINITVPLASIMKSIKGFTAYSINKLENRTGAFWQDESYDHMIRSRDELSDTIAYVLNNPVKSGLCKHYSEHPFTYVGQAFLPDN
jgi:putative transposase